MGRLDYEHFVLNKFGSVVLLNSPNWNIVPKWVEKSKMELAQVGPNPNPNSQKGVPPLGWDYQSQSKLKLGKYPVQDTATKSASSQCQKPVIGEDKRHFLA